MADQFKDKTAIVTGGASGIGHALCEALCRRGARVIVADIDMAGAERVASALCAAGGRAHAAYLDVTKFDIVEGLVTSTAAAYGHLDYMFNNAAATATRGELHGLPLDPWYRAIDVNLLGVVHGTVAAYAVMVRQGHGHIVNTGSLAGLVSFPTSIPYGASKAAVVNLSVALRMEAEERGVKVSVVCPGPIHGEPIKYLNLIGIESAAQLMLRGVERNDAMIVFPLFARVLWWLNRLSPQIVFPIGRKLIRDYRRKSNARS